MFHTKNHTFENMEFTEPRICTKINRNETRRRYQPSMLQNPLTDHFITRIDHQLRIRLVLTNVKNLDFVKFQFREDPYFTFWHTDHYNLSELAQLKNYSNNQGTSTHLVNY